MMSYISCCPYIPEGVLVVVALIFFHSCLFQVDLESLTGKVLSVSEAQQLQVQNDKMDELVMIITFTIKNNSAFLFTVEPLNNRHFRRRNLVFVYLSLRAKVLFSLTIGRSILDTGERILESLIVLCGVSFIRGVQL